MAKHALGNCEGVKRRSDLFHVDPNSITIVEGWNPRGKNYKFSPDDPADFDLIESVKENGVLQPILVRKTKDNVLELINGERRLSAALAAIKAGSDIISVPVMVSKRGASEADLFFESIIANDGKPLDAVGEADAFSRLERWGFTPAEIGKRVGRSLSHVKNRLELSSAAPIVKEAISNGDVTISAATQIVKEADGSMDKQASGLKKKMSAPKKKNMAMSIKNGSVRVTGGGSGCEPLEAVLLDDEIRAALVDAGFDPDSIKITAAQSRGNI